MLGDRDELVGREHAARRVPPPHERLGAPHPTRGQLDDRLEVHLERVFRDRLAQFGGEGEALGAVVVAPRRVHLARGVRLLGGVHRDVGPLQQRRGVVPVVRVERDADAAVDLEGEAVDRVRPGDTGEEVLGLRPRDVRAGDAGQQQRELVAAEAGHGVGVADVAEEPGRDLAQQAVAARVAERVVDLFEAVEVEQQHRDRVAAGAGAFDRLVEVLREAPTVRAGR